MQVVLLLLSINNVNNKNTLECLDLDGRRPRGDERDTLQGQGVTLTSSPVLVHSRNFAGSICAADLFFSPPLPSLHLPSFLSLPP